MFQSTRPMRGATLSLLSMIYYIYVSIHAPHAGRDYLLIWSILNKAFQSTRPMRGATNGFSVSILSLEFQSTRPMRGATQPTTTPITNMPFQSTRPMRGATITL